MAGATATEQIIANLADLSTGAKQAISVTAAERAVTLQIGRSEAAMDLYIHPQALADCDELVIKNNATQVRCFLTLVKPAERKLRLKLSNAPQAAAQFFLAAEHSRVALDCAMSVEQGSQLDCFLSIHNSSADIAINADVFSHANARFFGLTRSDAEEAVTIGMHVNHLEGKNHTEQKFYSYAAGKSAITFTGKISVSPGAGESVAHQLHRGTVLSREGRISAQPFLNIMHDDVRCTHGSTVGYIDEDARRYLMARGMAAADADKTLIASSQRQFVDALPAEAAAFFGLQGGDE